jgi:hypothetical protein
MPVEGVLNPISSVGDEASLANEGPPVEERR